jgi:hypothetical protein
MRKEIILVLPPFTFTLCPEHITDTKKTLQSAKFGRSWTNLHLLESYNEALP